MPKAKKAQPPPPERKPNRLPWIIGGLVAVLAVMSMCNSQGDNRKKTDERSRATTSATTTAKRDRPMMPEDGTYQIGGFNPQAIYYGTYRSAGSANGETPCIWFRRDETAQDGRLATGIIERYEAAPGRAAHVVLSHSQGDKYFTTVNCQPWYLVEMGS